ncbi:ankyrin repeat and fibronectin type-III domain-containing protein 1-like [Amphibalanus amphitrite]|uniref:ankyrin repeat and fibronectin type-III domain-containing protein 1-like n=1 Tax=Amphibalanus amphitrite TaxID=1232801 RepID=UPI001C918D41|nr:ankyrin repeat and fibronectin type-III domain-containing protein 1-like [Amphibalanus amphitrite]
MVHQTHEGRRATLDSFLSTDSRCSHLQELVRKAQRRVDMLTSYVSSTNGGKESEKQRTLWQRRLKLLNRMKVGFDQTRPPDPPARVTVEVTGPQEVRLRLDEPDCQHQAICTKYKVQWSTSADFSSVAGERDVTDLVPPPELPVRQLTQGRRYFFRAAAGNFCGWSRFVSSSPAGVLPSVWRDADQRVSRLSGKVAALDRLFTQIRDSRPQYASDLRNLDGQSESPMARKNIKKKSIKNLFQTAIKFQKHLRSGVYLASVIYHEDRVAMTTEDFLPVLEVDESYPSSIHADFHWLMKVACTWDDVRSLRQDMERSLSSSSVHFRIKLLAAAEQLQSALGVQDLGQLYFKPLRDSHGTLVFVVIYHMRSGKLPSASVRWQQVNKLQRKVSTSEEEPTVGESLISEIKDIITYHMVSSVGVSRGLYLGYLQCQTSVDIIRVSVSKDKPNVLPHVRVRDNPHVSSEEWEWLQESSSYRPPTSEEDGDVTPGVTSSSQSVTSRFRTQVETAVRRLLKLMDVPAEQAANHRLYNAEVLELNGTTSFLLLVPAADQVCSIKQTEELTAPNDCLRLPVQIFEMVHMMTYQRSFVSRYSRISSILETDTIMAQHAHREAFSDAEISEARGRLSQLQTFQTELEGVWRTSRWLTDAIAWARDKTQEGCPLSVAALRSWDGRDVSVSPVRDAKRLRKEEAPPAPSPAEFRRSSSQRLLKPRPEFQKSRTSECLLKSRGAGDEGRALLGYQDSSSEDSLSRPRPPNSARIVGGVGGSGGEGNGGAQLLSVASDLRKSSAPDVYVHADVERQWNAALSRSTPSFGERLAPPTRHLRMRGGGDRSPSDASSLASSARSLSSNDTETDTVSADEADDASAAAPGVLQVFAAYETGLAAGTSVRLHVTPRTCAREVVDLVVKQLNMAVVLKGRQGPVYSADQLRTFCLVAVIGARERCLRDDFRPLQLQNPWKRGKLFVRRRTEILAAIQQNSARDKEAV